MPIPLRVLFATWDGGGNIPPTVAAVRALVSRGHSVRVLAEDTCAADFRAAGAEVSRWRRAPNRVDRLRESDLTREWEVPDRDQILVVRDRLLLGPAEAYARDVLETLGTFDADVIVSNDMLFGAMVGAEAARTPFVVFSPNLPLFPPPGSPAFGPGFFPPQNDEERARDAHVRAAMRDIMDVSLPQFNATRAALGLAPLLTVMDLAGAADRIVIASAQEFDYPLPPLPERFRYIGPFLELPSWTPPEAGSEPPYDVLIAFSTTYQGQEDSLRNALEAVGDLPVRAVATLGPTLPLADFHAPKNVTVVAAGDHDRILHDARAVVTHAGHGTVMRALAHATPLVTLPMGRDQNDNAARVAYHGAGVRLDRTANAADIREALNRVLGDHTFRTQALRLSRAIRGYDPAEAFVSEIQKVASRAQALTDDDSAHRFSSTTESLSLR